MSTSNHPGKSRNQRRPARGRGGKVNPQTGGGPQSEARDLDSQNDPPILHTGIIRTGIAIVQNDDRASGNEGQGREETLSGNPFVKTQASINCQLPPLVPPSGPPIRFEGTIGGTMMAPVEEDPRIQAVSMGFPISVHPLRIPNTRAQHSSGSTHSVIDFDFLRLSGLLHTMVPLRVGVDDVKLRNNSRGLIDIKGYVDLVFDACGFEFEQRCWVMRLGFPLDIQLGHDWAVKYRIMSDFTGGYSVVRADAKRVRHLEDVYVTR